MSTSPTTTFHSFSRLPRELRFKIWNEANPQMVGQRAVTFTEVALPKSRDHRAASYVEIGNSVPMILLSSREVAEACHYATLGFRRSTRKILFSPMYDALRLATYGTLPTVRINKVLDADSLKLIHHLDLHGGILHETAFECNVDNINLVTNLETLKISGTFGIRPDFDAPPNINMKFESSTTDRAALMNAPLQPPPQPIYDPKCKADGKHLIGLDAVDAIHQRVTDNFERARFFDVFGFLNSASRECEHLPFCVEVFFRYKVYEWVTSDDGEVSTRIRKPVFDYGDVLDGLVRLY